MRSRVSRLMIFWHILWLIRESESYHWYTIPVPGKLIFIYERYIGYTSENSMLQIMYTYLINILDVETLGVVTGDEACPDPCTTHPARGNVESPRNSQRNSRRNSLSLRGTCCNEVEEEQLTDSLWGDTVSHSWKSLTISNGFNGFEWLVCIWSKVTITI